MDAERFEAMLAEKNETYRSRLTAYSPANLFGGVRELFAQRFPQLEVILPQPPLFLTPLAIAAHGLAGAYAEVQA